MDIEISMFRPNLDDIPAYALPEGYAMRPYQTGDIRHWVDFHVDLFEAGYINEALFRREFGHDEDVLKARQYYMTHGDEVMGSISAWFGSAERGRELGRIHWVVIREDYRGKGLAKPLLAFALHKLKQLGHKQAYLTTHPDLIPALNLYLQFGFEPEIHSEQHQQAWDEVYQTLNR